MSKLRSVLFPLALAVALTGCSQDATPQATPSLRSVGDISVVCAAPDADGNFHGRPLSACPDYRGEEGRHLFGLATQQETGEVAVLEMTQCQDGGSCPIGVQDLEPTQPGINFLPVGAEPVAIASTPGGSASFVLSADPGREGIFALPTRCIGPRPEKAPLRDIRIWPACRLPAPPATINVVVDSARELSCDGTDHEGEVDTGVECYTDLGTELGPQGRRKLLIALPTLGQLITVDAQRLLDSPPGRFEPCPIETTTTLAVELPAEPPVEVLPADLQAEASCRPQPSLVQAPQSFTPYPVDIALDGQRAFIADSGAPVVHVMDLSDACAPREVESLLPASYTRPDATIVTRKVAVSPVTSSGEQFVYAVDDSNDQTSGSVMIFDVSSGATERTPLVRAGSPLIPHEPPDRIQFGNEVRDVEFVVQDQPVADPATGVALEGVQCSADPADRGPGRLYRPDGTVLGPAPLRLRGIFAAIALESGFVSFIDIDDLDAECRRPEGVNTAAEADWRGCKSDRWSSPLQRAGTATVTDELSCNIIEPHRARAAEPFAALGVGAPALRSFPQLRAKDGSSLAVDRSDRGRLHPRMLGVNFSSSSESDEGYARVYVGATYYSNAADATDKLELDPSSAQRNSLVLPFAEPRSYGGNGVLPNLLTYEGVVRLPADSPFAIVDSAELAGELSDWTGKEERYGVFEGGLNADFCASGIEDVPLTTERIAEMAPDASAAKRASLAMHHADTVEITSELLDEDDSYWDASPGKSCGSEYQSASNSVRGRKLCQLFFGTLELPDAHRELRLLRAQSDRLIVEPREPKGDLERNAVLDLVECCFPGGVELQVRAADEWILRSGSELSHKIRTNPETLACERSCDPFDAHRDARVFELSCDGSACTDEDGEVSVGPSSFGEAKGEPAVCVLDRHPTGGLQPGAPGSQCIHEGLTSRFALYRGLAPSERGMQFNWTTNGGFSPFTVDLYQASGKSVTMPERLLFVKPINRLLVAEGGSAGLFLLGLRRDDGAPGLSFWKAQ